MPVYELSLSHDHLKSLIDIELLRKKKHVYKIKQKLTYAHSSQLKIIYHHYLDLSEKTLEFYHAFSKTLDISGSLAEWQTHLQSSINKLISLQSNFTTHYDLYKKIIDWALSLILILLATPMAFYFGIKQYGYFTCIVLTSLGMMPFFGIYLLLKSRIQRTLFYSKEIAPPAQRRYPHLRRPGPKVPYRR